MKEQALTRPCEAPEHVPGCHGRGTTKDHFTPEAIAKLLGWRRADREQRANIQYLSPACHRVKDRSTPHRLFQTKQQLMGGTIIFGEHIT